MLAITLWLHVSARGIKKNFITSLRESINSRTFHVMKLSWSLLKQRERVIPQACPKAATKPGGRPLSHRACHQSWVRSTRKGRGATLRRGAFSVSPGWVGSLCNFSTHYFAREKRVFYNVVILAENPGGNSRRVLWRLGYCRIINNMLIIFTTKWCCKRSYFKVTNHFVVLNGVT